MPSKIEVQLIEDLSDFPKKLRRKRILNFFKSQGSTDFSQRFLAKSFNLDQETIARDLKAMPNEIHKIDARKIMFEFTVLKSKCSKELLRIINSKEAKPFEKVAAMKEALTIADKEINNAAKLGFIELPSQQIEITENKKVLFFSIIKQASEQNDERRRICLEESQ